MSQDSHPDGYMPSLESMEISPAHAMITTNGGLISGHSIRVSLKDGTDFLFSLSTEELQKLFFVILKTLS